MEASYLQEQATTPLRATSHRAERRPGRGCARSALRPTRPRPEDRLPPLCRAGETRLVVIVGAVG